jgi:4-aminobutyrate aminotransferase-like enzyme
MKKNALLLDPRVVKAKELILEAVQDHTSHIQKAAPPDPALIPAYTDLLKTFNESRGAPLFYPYLGSGLGRGSLVELLDGSVKYDMITGIGVHELGHSHPRWIAASLEASLQDTIMQGNLQQNMESALLAKEIIRLSQLPHCFFTTSGAMANENALKAAFQKNAPASRILAFERCFAGRSFTLSQITDKPSFREGLPLNIGVDYLPFYDPARAEESTDKACTLLRKYITRYPKGYALMLFELIQGEAGFYPGSRSFFEPLMKICRENHIAILADEIQTFGRTTQLFAFQHFGLEPYVDIATMGKMCQVCATLFTQEYAPKPGLLSQTFTGATSAIFACRALLDILTSGPFLGEKGRIAAIYQRFENHFLQLEKEFPHLIEGPYGIGGMIAFTPLKGQRDSVIRFVHALFDAGVLSFIAGSNPTRVRFLVPALVITDQEIDEVMHIVKNTLTKQASDVPR